MAKCILMFLSVNDGYKSSAFCKRKHSRINRFIRLRSTALLNLRLETDINNLTSHFSAGDCQYTILKGYKTKEEPLVNKKSIELFELNRSSFENLCFIR